MIGRALAPLAPPSRRLVYRVWGFPDVHARQKWRIVWPWLARLPLGPLTVIDAGCGVGHWTLDLAARRPGWTITGLDLLPSAVAQAETARDRLGLPNARFVAADFAAFRPERPADAVLAVMSTHYAAAEGGFDAVLAAFARWLRPGGTLILLAPRARTHAPFVGWLPRAPWPTVMQPEEIARACAAAGLAVERLEGRVGRIGTFAKQLSWLADRGPTALALATYPLRLGLSAVDERRSITGGAASLMCLLVARAGAPAGAGEC